MSVISARAISATLGAAMLLASASAGAQEIASTTPKAECVNQLDRAQSLQTARKLQEARASFLACAAATCPDLVREDCTRSLVELQRALPTVVLSASTRSGSSLAKARRTAPSARRS